MSIEEAIKRYSINAEYERTHGNLQGCLEFRQLAEWLKELKAHREAFVKIKEEINSQNGGICDYFIVDRIEEIINEYRPKEGDAE